MTRPKIVPGTIPGKRKHSCENLTGNKYTRLIVKEFAHFNKRGNSVWRCVCDCGKEVETVGSTLKNGVTKSCGCLTREIQKECNFKTHGLSRSYTYSSWAGIKQRCENVSNKHYPNYGGRGITVWPAWRHDFIQFLEDMGERPKGTSLDRIDNNGNYEPGNCRWASRKVQSNNTRRNKFATINGKSLSASQLSIETGISRRTIARRMQKGCPVDLLLSKSKISYGVCAKA